MRNTATRSALVLGLGLTAAALTGVVSAGDVDGKRNLVCASIDVVGCRNEPGCLEGHARTFDLPQFMFVDFEKKAIRANAADGSEVVSPVRNYDITDTQLILQGVENHRGWTAAIDRQSGDFLLTSAGADVSFIIFGACTAL